MGVHRLDLFWCVILNSADGNFSAHSVLVMQARRQGCCYRITPARGLDDYLAACRFNNPPLKELAIAAGEQMKITELRLAQLWEGKQAAHARRAGRVLAHVQGAAH